MTDEQLVFLAQGGDKEAQETLLNRYKNVVRAIARRFFLYGGETDDLIQEGMIGLYSAIESYNSQRSLFSTYARRCIRNKILDAVKSNRSYSNSALNNFQPIVEVGEELFEGIDNPENLLIKSENRKEFLQKIGKILSSYEFQVIILYMDGLTLHEIAETLGKDLKSIDNALVRARAKLYKKFTEN